MDKVILPLNEMQGKLKRVLPTLPLLAGNEVVNFSKDRFRFGNWRGSSIEPWKKRAGKRKQDKGRALLIKSGRLKRSIRITQRTSDTVAVGTDVPYAKIHNEGGTITRHPRSELFQRNRHTKGAAKGRFKNGTVVGRGITFRGSKTNMPQRQFLGQSPWLTKKIQVTITKTIMNALK